MNKNIKEDLKALKDNQVKNPLLENLKENASAVKDIAIDTTSQMVETAKDIIEEVKNDNNGSAILDNSHNLKTIEILKENSEEKKAKAKEKKNSEKALIENIKRDILMPGFDYKVAYKTKLINKLEDIAKTSSKQKEVKKIIVLAKEKAILLFIKKRTSRVQNKNFIKKFLKIEDENITIKSAIAKYVNENKLDSFNKSVYENIVNKKQKQEDLQINEAQKLKLAKVEKMRTLKSNIKKKTKKGISFIMSSFNNIRADINKKKQQNQENTQEQPNSSSQGK